MLFFIIILAFVGFSFAHPAQAPLSYGRIVGGTQVDIKDFPYQLSLRYLWIFHRCGASLISPKVAVTAAHCTKGCGTPIALPTENQIFPAGTVAVVSGWGRIRENGPFSKSLLTANVPLVNQTICQNVCHPITITDNMICAGYLEGGKDACQGDSGGPLAVDGILVGVVSFGIGCARPGNPGVYANIPALRGWIKDATGI